MMEENTYLTRADYRSSLPLIDVDNLDTLTMKESKKAHKKERADHLGGALNIHDAFDSTISSLPAGYGGLIGIAAYLVAVGVVAIAKSVHKKKLYTTVNKGLRDGIHYLRNLNYPKAIAAGEKALIEVDRLLNRGLYSLFKLSKGDKDALRALKLLLKYNLAVAYVGHYHGVGGKNPPVELLDTAVSYLKDVNKEVTKISLRANPMLERRKAGANLSIAVVKNNAACDAAEQGDWVEAKHYMAAAKAYSSWSRGDPNAKEVLDIIDANWHKVLEYAVQQERVITL